MMLGKEKSKILVLAPHTDDAEFGCGATLSKLIRQGHEVYQVAFSTANMINQHGMRNKQLEQEVKDASFTIGMNPDNLFIHDFTTRNFAEDRQKILDLILYYKSKIQPDIIFVPSGNDIHQDHQVIHNEALRAFKFDTILGYELIWNLFTFNYQLFFHLEEQDVNNKIDAILCFKSQYHRGYCKERIVKSHLISRGTQCKTDYAEVFEVIRINQKNIN